LECLVKTDAQNQTIKGEGEKGREKTSSPFSLLSEDIKNTELLSDIPKIQNVTKNTELK